MKTRIMMMTAVLALFFGFANGANDPEDYEYVPVVRETVGWIYDWQTKPPMKMGKYFLTFSGDSVINGKTYKVCYRYQTPKLYKEEAFIEGFAREEDKRVYVISRRQPDGNATGNVNAEEVLAYDFNVELGGCIHLLEGDIQIEHIGYVRINSKLRKAYFTKLGGESVLWAVEGIGFVANDYYNGDLLSPYMKTSESEDAFRCRLAYVVKNMNIVGYDYEFSHDNFDFDGVQSVIGRVALEFIIGNGRLTITSPDCEVVRTQIVAVNGRVVRDSRHKGLREVAIPTNDFEEGIYVVVAYTSDGQMISQRVIFR